MWRICLLLRGQVQSLRTCARARRRKHGRRAGLVIAVDADMSLRILLCDDDSSREALAALLRDDGLDVVMAARGQEVMERMAWYCPDILITSLHMPNLDGLELIRGLRAAGSALRVIAMSRYSNHGTAALSAGADEFFAKPICYEDLLASIHRWLAGASALQRPEGSAALRA